jgi:hypothetical protein
MPRTRDSRLLANFEFQTTTEGPYASCNHCLVRRVDKAERLLGHLSKCQKYLAKQRRQVTLAEDNDSSSANDGTTTKGVFRISNKRMKRLHQLLADALYRDNRAFTTFHTPAMVRFFTALNPAFKLPSITAIRTTHLDKAYGKARDPVEQLMKNSTYLSFSSDGSTDGAHHGVINLCYVHPNHASYVLSTRETQGTDETAVAGASAIKERLLEVTGSDLGRVSSLAFDTCPTQLAIFNIMKRDDDLRHVIAVLCDAHGLNLFLKDVFKLPWFAKVFEDANSVAVAFARSNQQYWLLQSFHKPLNKGRETAIQSAGDTRWITLIKLFKSLKKLKLALREMVDDRRCTLATEVKTVILNRSFWLHLNETVQVLTLFNNAIIESQAATARMHMVIPRWLRLRDELLKLKTHSDVEAPIDEIVNGSEEIRISRRDARTITGFEERFKRQVNCHHYAAFHLDPSNVKIIPSAYEQEQVLEAFRRVTKSEDEYRQMKQHWFHFRRQIDEFSLSDECWLDETMEDFWYGQSVITPLIASYGLRLATTVANTTISERGFHL